jgi:2-dehydropantoate 2-reductase
MPDDQRDFQQVVVLGAGGIGSYYGALLSEKVDVLLVGRGEHVEAINSRGLEIKGLYEGGFKISATTTISETGIGAKALILITTKAYDLKASILGIRESLRSDTTLLLLQNGYGNKDLVEGILGAGVMVVRGLVSTGVEFLKPGIIDVKFTGEAVLPESPTGRRIKELFESCGLETRLAKDMDYEVWKKLCINCVINPLTAILRVPNNRIAVESLEWARQRIVEECREVAEREGVILEEDLAERITRAAALYSNMSSMYQDILKGGRTEIDFLNGKITELGAKHGVETTVNRVMVALIKYMEGRRRDEA